MGKDKRTTGRILRQIHLPIHLERHGGGKPPICTASHQRIAQPPTTEYHRKGNTLLRLYLCHHRRHTYRDAATDTQHTDSHNENSSIHHQRRFETETTHRPRDDVAHNRRKGGFRETATMATLARHGTHRHTGGGNAHQSL